MYAVCSAQSVRDEVQLWLCLVFAQQQPSVFFVQLFILYLVLFYVCHKIGVDVIQKSLYSAFLPIWLILTWKIGVVEQHLLWWEAGLCNHWAQVLYFVRGVCPDNDWSVWGLWAYLRRDWLEWLWVGLEDVWSSLWRAQSKWPRKWNPFVLL